MNPRLQNLIRQRESIREHLRWLDEEIAAEGNRAVPVPLPPVDGPVAPSPTPVIADEPDLKAVHGDVRRGCLLYAAIAVAALAALVAWIYWKY